MRVLTRTILPIALVILVLDRLTKWWVVDVLDLPGTHEGIYEVFPPFLNFVMAWNRGINFGLFGDSSPWVLIAIAVVISLALLIWAARRGTTTIGVGAGLVIGGAIGNAWDRASEWGAVADFLNMSCCGFDNPYSFNIADIAIFAGAVWIALRA